MKGSSKKGEIPLRRKKEAQRIFGKRILIGAVGFLFLVLLIASFFGKRGLLEIYQARKDKQTLLHKIERLEEKKKKLQEEIEDLKNNPQAVERKARQKLMLVKPDEIVIIEQKK